MSGGCFRLCDPYSSAHVVPLPVASRLSSSMKRFGVDFGQHRLGSLCGEGQNTGKRLCEHRRQNGVFIIFVWLSSKALDAADDRGTHSSLKVLTVQFDRLDELVFTHAAIVEANEQPVNLLRRCHDRKMSAHALAHFVPLCVCTVSWRSANSRCSTQRVLVSVYSSGALHPYDRIVISEHPVLSIVPVGTQRLSISSQVCDPALMLLVHSSLDGHLLLSQSSHHSLAFQQFQQEDDFWRRH
mmetsp:Transcript_31048/g.45402  ORF Transcript_31048/g.45402 Transcript_31048/m.45402 type:complete len:241 (-) Transcript_31048:144-866(-)